MAGSLIISACSVFLAVLDVLTYRIPNKAVFPCFILAAALRLWQDGGDAIPDMAAGALIPFAACFILFALSMMGAGDIKLMMMAGIYAGAAGICRIMLTGLIIAGVIAAVKLLAGRMSAFRGFYFINYLRGLIIYISGGRYGLRGSRPSPYISKEEVKEKKPWLMHLSVPVAAAVVYCLVIKQRM